MEAPLSPVSPPANVAMPAATLESPTAPPKANDNDGSRDHASVGISDTLEVANSEGDAMGAPNGTSDTPSVKSPVDQEELPDLSESSTDGEAESDVDVAFRSMTSARDVRFEQRLKSAPQRLKQSLLYTKLMEDRVAALENDLRKLKGTDLSTARPIDQFPPSILEIKRMGWEEFKPQHSARESGWKHVAELDLSPRHVLEVLTESPWKTIQPSEDSVESKLFNDGDEVAAATSNKNRWSVAYDDKVPAQSVEDRGYKKDKKKPSVIVPERLRINSPYLVRLLGEVCRASLGYSNYRHKTTLIRPFKILVMFEDKIRSFYEELERLHTPGSPASVVTDTSEKDVRFSTPPPATPRRHDDRRSTRHSGQEYNIKSYEAFRHLQLLIEFMDVDMVHFQNLRREIKDGALQKIAFPDLWHLFDYGQDVRSCGTKNLQLYKVGSFTGGRPVIDSNRLPADGTIIPKYPVETFVLECFYFEFDGSQCGPKYAKFPIRRFEGLRDVTSLPVYPLNCDPQKDQTWATLMARGEKFAALANTARTAHREYNGLSVGKTQELIESQVIIDFELAFLKRPDLKPALGLGPWYNHDSREQNQPINDLGSCGTEGCCGNDYLEPDYPFDEDERKDFEESNKHLMDMVDSTNELGDRKVLLPGCAHGFVLRNRNWQSFDIDLLQNVDYRSGWDDLILPRTHKDTVLALVENRTGSGADDERNVTRNNAKPVMPVSMDIVRGKGRGLIILLHGEPGVGKTSTAECVADHTRRPLFPITCGDIGDTADDVQRSLETNFQLAHKWGCVLLLDEADVFLQKRNKTDLKRNAIVSVFLRNLEYYSGILFLTTNRVGMIDQAFKSRIHVTLYYPKLDRKATLKIWRNHLSKLKEIAGRENPKFKIERKEIMQFAREHFDEQTAAEKIGESRTWNGRQVRNAFQTAVALAQFEARGATPTLNSSQFIKVAEASIEFDRYLKVLSHEVSESYSLKKEKIRLDEYDAGPKKVWETPRKAARRKRRQVPDSSDESETTSDSEASEPESTEEEAPVKKGKSLSNKKKKSSKSKTVASESELSTEEEKPAKKRSSKSKSKKGPTEASVETESSSESSVPKSSRRKDKVSKSNIVSESTRTEKPEKGEKARKSKGKKVQVVSSEDSSTDDDAIREAEPIVKKGSKSTRA